jgi:hypothetical protein
LDLNDQFSPRQLRLQTLGLTLQPSIFGGLGISLPATLGGRQALLFAARPLVAPGVQVRRV